MASPRPQRWPGTSRDVDARYGSIRRAERPPLRRHEACPHGSSGDYVLVVTPRLRQSREALRVEFDALVSEWQMTSLTASSIHEVALTPSYQSMIGLGRSILPLLLKSLENEGGPHWFWALRAIARTDAAAGAASVEAARVRWLEWGRSRGNLA